MGRAFQIARRAGRVDADRGDAALAGEEYLRAMRLHRRPDPFPPDRGLQARMLATAVGTPLLVLGCLAAIVAFGPPRLVFALVVATIVGVAGIVHERAERPEPDELTPAQAPTLHAAVERLCVLADLPKPRIVLEPEDQPNSWLVGLSRGRSRLHVTRGLLELLSAEQLEAVIAHELAHAAHRDAAVMTAVGGPGAVLLGGGMRMSRGGGFWFLWIGGAVAAGIGWLSRLGTQALSRHRELAADAAAASLTGHPAALASALRAVSGQLRVVPREDLRVAAARDLFHLMPVGEASGWTATHPPLSERIERLERMERAMRAARLVDPGQ
jgi:heat shock protein HtpX